MYQTSPGYPERYGNDLECHWAIIGPLRSKVSIVIEDFNVEYHPQCEWDYLMIE